MPLKRRVYVKPVTSKTEMFGWLAIELNIFEAFVDDRRRYGVFTAMRNFLKTAFLSADHFTDK